MDVKTSFHFSQIENSFFFKRKNTSLCYSYESKDIFYNISMMISWSHDHTSTKVDINTEQQNISYTNLRYNFQIPEPTATNINDKNCCKCKRKSLIIADFSHHPWYTGQKILRNIEDELQTYKIIAIHAGKKDCT